MQFTGKHLPAALYRTLVVLALLAAAASYALLSSDDETSAQSTVVPAAPTGLTTAPVSHGTVALSWDDPGDDSITGYRILRRDPAHQGPGVFSTLVSNTGSAATSYTDGAVAAETRYVYRVKAINSKGLSGQSNYVNVETPAAPVSSGVPAKPTGLSAASVAHDSVALSWHDPGDGSITGYRVLRRSRDGNEYEDGEGAAAFVAVAEDTGSPATSHTDTSVTARTRYVYRVQAIIAAGLSERSTYLNVETPAGPSSPAPVPGAVWSATLRAGEMGESRGHPYHGYDSVKSAGALSSDAFDYDGQRFEVSAFGFSGSAQSLGITLDRPLEPGAVLRVGAHEFTITDAPTRSVPDHFVYYYEWSTGAFDWAAGDEVEVHLLPPAALSALGLEGLPELDFSPGERRYDVSAPPETSTATVDAPTASEDTGVLILTVGSDGELEFDDSDASEEEDGHQAPLSTGGQTLILVQTEQEQRQRVYVVRVSGGEATPDSALTAGHGSAPNPEVGFLPAAEPRTSSGPSHAALSTTGVPLGPTLSATATTAGDLAAFWPTGAAHASGRSLARSPRVRSMPSVVPGTTSDASLETLSITGVPLSPAFRADAFLYTATVDADTGQVTVSATATAAGAGVVFRPSDADGNADGHQVDLAEGVPGGQATETAVTVVVRSPDNTQLESYIVTVRRAAPDPVAQQQRETREAADSGGFLQVDAGWDYACGLRVDGTVTCWLGTDHGHGHATESTFYISYPPEERDPEGTYSFIANGNSEHCAVGTDGDPTCWGWVFAGISLEARQPKPLSSIHLHSQYSNCWLHTDGDIGCGGALSPPDAITSGAPFQDVVTGRNFACGLKEDGDVLCWDHDGPLDPPDVNLKFISGGGYGICGIGSADDNLICWEWSYKYTPDPHPDNSYATVASTPSGGFKFVDTSYTLACGVRMNGTVVCWGLPANRLQAPELLNETPEGPFETVSIDWWHFACGLRTDRTVACWGNRESDNRLAARVAPPYESPWKNNADLLALELSAGQLSPSFDRETTSYTASVANDVASLTLSPGLTNTLATYEIGSDTDSDVSGDTVDLTAGENVVTVTVLSADTTETRTYTVTVTRASP